jgi:hypothetical protein
MQNMTVENTLTDIEYLHTGWKKLSPQDKAIKRRMLIKNNGASIVKALELMDELEKNKR